MGESLQTLEAYARAQANHLVVTVLRKYPDLQRRKDAIGYAADLLLSHVYTTLARDSGVETADRMLKVVLVNLSEHVQEHGFPPPRVLIVRTDAPVLPDLGPTKPQRRKRRRDR